MSNHSSCAHAGMLLLTHGTHQHLRRVRACLAGALSTPDDLVHDVRRWHKTRLCNLGFFRSIDSRLPKLRSFKLPEFIGQIEEAYEEYPEEKLEALCSMKTRVCACIVENEGQK